MKKILILTTSLFAFYQTSAIAAAPYPQYEALVEKHAALQRLDKTLYGRLWGVRAQETVMPCLTKMREAFCRLFLGRQHGWG